MKLFPSIASADPLALGAALQGIGGWPFVHIDIEDGNFTPNITFGMKTASALCRAAGSMQIGVHLMVTDPMDYLRPLSVLGVTAVTANIEALAYPMRFLNGARALGMRGGLAFNIKTDPAEAQAFLPMCDHLLVMTSEPDEAGELLCLPALEKALALAESLRHSEICVYADGGLDEAALARLHKSGANGAVLGRLVFGVQDPIGQLRRLAEPLA